MIDEKWDAITDHIRSNFEVEEEAREDMDLPGYEGGNAYVEFVIFEGPLGRMMVERRTEPKRQEAKTLYSRRIGGETAVQHRYDESELIKSFAAFKWDDDAQEWTEMEAGSLLG